MANTIIPAAPGFFVTHQEDGAESEYSIIGWEINLKKGICYAIPCCDHALIDPMIERPFSRGGMASNGVEVHPKWVDEEGTEREMRRRGEEHAKRKSA